MIKAYDLLDERQGIELYNYPLSDQSDCHTFSPIVVVV